MLDDIPQERRLEYKDAFEMFDKNKDGTISTKDLINVLRSLNQDPTEEELNEMIAEVDLDGNGEIALLDAVMVLNHYLEKTLLTGPYMEAADTNTDADNYQQRLADALRGNFPGSEWTDPKKGTIPFLKSDISYSIASASNIPTEKSEKFISQTIEILSRISDGFGISQKRCSPSICTY